MVWPCFVDCICSDDWYLSFDELLVLYDLARMNVAIYEERADGFHYGGGVVGHSGPMLHVGFERSDGDATRGHYSRLVFPQAPMDDTLII